MELKTRIQQNLNSALKEKKELEVLVLRQILAAVLNKEKEKRFKSKKEEDALLTEEEITDVVSSEAKKRREAIVEFEKGKRQDLAEKEKKELEILEKYLPEQLPEEEIRKLVKEAIEAAGAKEIKDMGKVMAELMPKTKGRVDNSLVSRIVRELLASA
ncbi:MAG TPA: GatB/YqeY domain-containing protein [Patescibacteria group bacterium]|nr:GatB/YqeY domain-containing protein [Patescibacteria group bacterium]